MDGELAIVLSSIALACKQIASLVTRAGISNLTGLGGLSNSSVRFSFISSTRLTMQPITTGQIICHLKTGLHECCHRYSAQDSAHKGLLIHETCQYASIIG